MWLTHGPGGSVVADPILVGQAGGDRHVLAGDFRAE